MWSVWGLWNSYNLLAFLWSLAEASVDNWTWLYISEENELKRCHTRAVDSLLLFCYMIFTVVVVIVDFRYSVSLSSTFVCMPCYQESKTVDIAGQLCRTRSHYAVYAQTRVALRQRMTTRVGDDLRQCVQCFYTPLEWCLLPPHTPWWAPPPQTDSNRVS